MNSSFEIDSLAKIRSLIIIFLFLLLMITKLIGFTITIALVILCIAIAFALIKLVNLAYRVGYNNAMNDVKKESKAVTKTVNEPEIKKPHQEKQFSLDKSDFIAE